MQLLPGMAGELEELAYDLAQQALAEQDNALDELRTRTGTLLAASSLVASFLGGRAIDASAFSWANVVALCAFGATALLSVSVLFPRRGLALSFSGPVIYEDFVTQGIDITEAHRRLAYWIQGAYAQNMRVLNRLFWAFRGACFALLGEVVFWAVALGLH